MTDKTTKKKAAFITPLRDFAESANPAKIALVLQGKGPQKPSPQLTPAKNFRRILRLVGVHPRYYLHPKNFFPQFWKAQTRLCETNVLIRYLDDRGRWRERKVATDHDGYVKVDPDEVGREIEVTLPESSPYQAERKKASLFHFSRFKGDTVYFSDHDDTVKFTGVVSTFQGEPAQNGDLKRRYSKTNIFQTTLTNPYIWHTFPGAAALAQGIVDSGEGEKVPMVVITGSPKFLSEDIHLFYEVKGFPRPAAVHLKDSSEDRDSNKGYKQEIFARALEGAVKQGTLKKVVIDGDRGEGDPEVAHHLAGLYPQLDFFVGVHNITSEDRKSPRFHEIRRRNNVELVVYNNKWELAQFLHNNGVLGVEVVEEVADEIHRNNEKILELIRAGKIRRRAKSLPSSTISLEELVKYHLFFPEFKKKANSRGE